MNIVFAVDAETLDSLDSLQFLRSDVDDTFHGSLTIKESDEVYSFILRNTNNKGKLLFGGTSYGALIQIGQISLGEKLALNPLGGKVGIGTSSPTSRLTICEDNGIDAIAIRNSTKNKLFVGGTSYGARIQIGQISLGEKLSLNPEGGKVGIGTTNPGDELDVAASGSPGIKLTNTGDSDSAVFEVSSNALNIFRNGAIKMSIKDDGKIGIGTQSPAYQLQVEGNGIDAVSYHCRQKDMAEKLPVHPDYQLSREEIRMILENSPLQDEEKERIIQLGEISKIERGTVVVITDKGITPCNRENDTALAGIVSTEPAVKMGSQEEGQYIALAGKVPCKVTGKIKAGDLLTTSSLPGHAQKASIPIPYSIVGKALEDFDGSSGMISIWVNN